MIGLKIRYKPGMEMLTPLIGSLDYEGTDPRSEWATLRSTNGQFLMLITPGTPYCTILDWARIEKLEVWAE